MESYDANMTYELFIRHAFSIGKDMIGRGGDPAGLANTHSFTETNIANVKVVTAYAMVTYNSHIFDLDKNPSEKEQDLMKKYIVDVINAPNIKEVCTYITGYKNILDKYYSPQK